MERFVVKAAIEKALNKDTIERLTQKLLAYQSRENTRLPVLPAALKDVNKPIENIVSAIEQGIIIPATKQRLDDLEEQRKALETNILQEQIAKPLLTREQILFRFERFRQGDPSVSAYQRNIIDCFVNSVYIFDDRFVVNFNYRDGDKLVSLQEVKSSSLAEYGLPFEPSFSDGSFLTESVNIAFFTPYSQDFTQNAPGIDCSACFLCLDTLQWIKRMGHFSQTGPDKEACICRFLKKMCWIL